jgi:hypothetical protein
MCGKTAKRRKIRTKTKTKSTNKNSTFKPVNSDQFQIGPRKPSQAKILADEEFQDTLCGLW